MCVDDDVGMEEDGFEEDAPRVLEEACPRGLRGPASIAPFLYGLYDPE